MERTETPRVWQGQCCRKVGPVNPGLDVCLLAALVSSLCVPEVSSDQEVTHGSGELTPTAAVAAVAQLPLKQHM